MPRQAKNASSFHKISYKATIQSLIFNEFSSFACKDTFLCELILFSCQKFSQELSQAKRFRAERDLTDNISIIYIKYISTTNHPKYLKNLFLHSITLYIIVIAYWRYFSSNFAILNLSLTSQISRSRCKSTYQLKFDIQTTDVLHQEYRLYADSGNNKLACLSTMLI